jgi:hypothetical protein
MFFYVLDLDSYILLFEGEFFYLGWCIILGIMLLFDLCVCW